jgi:hypothetical protein
MASLTLDAGALSVRYRAAEQDGTTTNRTYGGAMLKLIGDALLAVNAAVRAMAALFRRVLWTVTGRPETYDVLTPQTSFGELTSHEGALREWKRRLVAFGVVAVAVVIGALYLSSSSPAPARQPSSTTATTRTRRRTCVHPPHRTDEAQDRRPHTMGGSCGHGV